MGKRLFYWELAGALWVLLAALVLGKLYGWTGGASWAAGFSAVSGSVWERMKTLYLPVFLFTLVQLPALGGQYQNLLAVRAVSAAAGVLAVPALTYTCAGALGFRRAWADALIFCLAAGGIFLLDSRLLRRRAVNAGWCQLLGLAALWGGLFAFVWYSFRPLDLPLFQG